MSIDPFDSLPIRMGMAYAASGSRKEASAVYSRALTEDPDCFAAHFLLGVEACVDHEWEEGFRHFVSTIDRAPALAEPYHNLGIVYWQQGDFDSAQKCWQKAISLRVRFPEAILALGLAYLASQHMHEALTCMERAISFWRSPATLTAMGVTLFRTGQFHEAGACFVKAAGLAPHMAAPLRNLAVLYRARGQEAEAQHCMSQASCARDQSGYFLTPLHVLLPLAQRVGAVRADEYEGPPCELVVYDLDEEAVERG